MIQGRPQVNVALDDKGRFSTRELGPGVWRVRWHTAASGLAEERRVELPDAARFELRLEYPELAVRGVVTDAESRPIAGARVRELSTGTTVLSGVEGGFELGLLAAGSYRLRATSAELASEIAAVEVFAGHETEPIELVLAAAAFEEVEIRLLDAGQRPAGGALVFLETEKGPGQILSCDLEGRARARFEPPQPARVRVAALAGGVWVLGDWMGWEDAAAGVSLETAPAGAASIVAEKGVEGMLGLRSAGGWDLGWLMLRIGHRLGLEPGVPLVLSGLPEGGYTLSVGAETRSLRVEAGDVAEIELR